MREAVNRNTGITAGIIACILAVLGILFIGIIFIPLAAIVTTIGTIISVKNRNMAGIGVNLLAWILTIVGVAVSPALLAFLSALFTVA